MTSKKDILHLLALYNNHFPNEVAGVHLFSDYLSRTGADCLINRKNFDGHITTSAFIIDTATSEMLLLRHKSLNRWLQPGGHVEEQDQSLLHSATREAVEETGISAEQLQHYPIHDIAEVPFDIDSHYIPTNPKKAEDGHYHHDLRYLFVYNGNRENTYDPDEATGLRWVSFDELMSDDTFAAVVMKIRDLSLTLSEGATLYPNFDYS